MQSPSIARQWNGKRWRLIVLREERLKQNCVRAGSACRGKKHKLQKYANVCVDTGYRHEHNLVEVGELDDV